MVHVSYIVQAVIDFLEVVKAVTSNISRRPLSEVIVILFEHTHKHLMIDEINSYPLDIVVTNLSMVFPLNEAR